MHIDSIRIDGFGVYRDEAVSGLPRGLVVFSGENESGKTTLMQFIRVVLFGFPVPRTKLAGWYPPLHGGRHGGRLRLASDGGGVWIVDRDEHHVSISRDDGPPEEAEPGERLLGGLDRHAFEHVFAVGLGDLQGLDILSAESVRARILAAGAGLGAGSVVATVRSLDAELADLLSRTGRKQRINQIQAEQRENEAQIRALREQAREFGEHRRRREALEAEIRAGQAEMARLNDRLLRLRHLRQAVEPWLRLKEERLRRESLAFARGFPPGGLPRFEELKRQIEEIEKSLAERGGELARTQSLLETLRVDEALLANAARIEAANAGREKILAALDDLPRVAVRLDRARDEHRRNLADLGGDWDDGRLAAVDTSVELRQFIMEVGRRIDGCERKLESAQLHVSRMEQTVDDARANADRAARRLAERPEPPGSEPVRLRAKQDALRVVRSALQKREIARARTEARKAARDQTAARLAAVRPQYEADRRRFPVWLAPAVPAAAFVVALVLALAGKTVAGLLLLAAGLAVGLLVHLLRARVQQAGREIRRLEDELGAHDAETELAARQADEIAALIERAAAEAGMAPPDDLSDVERVEIETARLAEDRHDWEARRREAEEAERRLKAAEEGLAKAAEDMLRCNREADKLDKYWQSWLQERGFGKPVRPQGFETIVLAVEKARNSAEAARELQRRHAEILAYVQEATRGIADLLAACGRQPAGPKPGVEDLDALCRDVRQAREDERKRGDLRRQIESLREAAAREQAALEARRREREALFREAGVEEEDEFRRVAEAAARLDECQRRIDQAEQALRILAGTDEALAEMEDELARAQPVDLDRQIAGGQARLEELQARVDQLRQETGALDQRMADMARDERLGELLLRRQTLDESLRESVRRWAVLALCRELVEDARAFYERERQPKVVREANTFLQTLVNGRYRLVSSIGEDPLHLEATDLQRKDERAWSSGLADQVYLAVRLGLARELSRRSEPLFVILDDVLVKFDPERRRAAARVILEFAREQQVLLFSCDPALYPMIDAVRREHRLEDVQTAHYRIKSGHIRAER